MQLQPIKQSFQVQYDYQLYFTSGLFALENQMFVNLIADYKDFEPVKLLFVLDDGVKHHHPSLIPQIEDYCKAHRQTIKYTDTLVLPGGEQVKNSDTAIESVLKGVNDNKICRHSFVVVIGGGAVIDMVGYAAAIAHRGVKLIRIPTTVLSQNDSAVGVKNSVNAFKKKNFLGTFAPPFAIINDSDFLETLEQRDWISGISEAIKVALIKDKTFFKYIADNAVALKNREMEAMQYVIYKCAEMHMHHIAQGGDPFESGSSRPLDFGHWAAHKMEFMTNYELRHGEAVAKGIALDVTYAQLVGLISEEDLQHILDVMIAIGFDLSLPVQNDDKIEQLLNGIEEFREHLGGQLTITLISDLGVKHDVHTIDMELMSKAITKLNHQFALN
ncbi:MAG TPA: 3-dehydroquinate synthase [Maribacter sp.]|uniref:3-dehydroquinate synthase n=1 Tax=unclassified Maribacter TaxID=2615042 RepID=UPI000EBB76E0|nr:MULTISPECIES: 3-dehydroquinate synthase [unclassified Maribacter]HAF77589.1 3-dehydroquinate synthase [Maribacter sp.]|tara:strand:- start:34868 stop:36028 length:1161 start_codon:yes stop_codon:yes gene_type:complete